MAAAFEHHDFLADQALGIGWARAAVAVDDLRGHFQVRVREFRLGRAPLAADQAGGCQHRAGGFAEVVEQLIEVVGSLDLQLHPEIVGEMLDQLVLETGFAVAILKVGGRAVAGDHAQHAILLHALEGAGFFNAGTEQQKESGCEKPFGATLAQSSVGEHRLQYTQRTGSTISRQRLACLVALDVLCSLTLEVHRPGDRAPRRRRSISQSLKNPRRTPRKSDPKVRLRRPAAVA